MTVLLAILLALGVPFAQLQTAQDRTSCCCPDPTHCKCPDHKPDKSGQSKINACHKQTEHAARAAFADFVAPPLVRLVVPVQRALRVEYALPAPHAPPVPERPAAPS